MSKIRLYGDTSGYVDLTAPAVADNSALSIGDIATSSDIASVGTYQTWTPSMLNTTFGNGVVTAYYTKVGQFVHAWMDFQLGSTSSISGTVVVYGMPQFASVAAARAAQVQTSCIDSSTGAVRWGSSHLANNNTEPRIWPTLFSIASTGTAVINPASDITATVPWTWATGDRFIMSATYMGTE